MYVVSDSSIAMKSTEDHPKQRGVRLLLIQLVDGHQSFIPSAVPTKRRAGTLDLVGEIALNQSAIIVGDDGALQFLSKGIRCKQLRFCDWFWFGAAQGGKRVANTEDLCASCLTRLRKEHDMFDRLSPDVTGQTISGAIGSLELHSGHWALPELTVAKSQVCPPDIVDFSYEMLIGVGAAEQIGLRNPNRIAIRCGIA